MREVYWPSFDVSEPENITTLSSNVFRTCKTKMFFAENTDLNKKFKTDFIL